MSNDNNNNEILKRFVKQSNAIERIFNEDSLLKTDIEAHEKLLKYDVLTVNRINEFVNTITKGFGKLRNKDGMNVYVGSHKPIKGSPLIEEKLKDILNTISTSNKLLYTPYKMHCIYEALHPYTDGNGRSGRAIWLWHMARVNNIAYPFIILKYDFLHSWYYQSLENWQEEIKNS